MVYIIWKRAWKCNPTFLAVCLFCDERCSIMISQTWQNKRRENKIMEEKEKQLTDAELDKVSGGEEIPHDAEEEVEKKKKR